MGETVYRCVYYKRPTRGGGRYIGAYILRVRNIFSIPLFGVSGVVNVFIPIQKFFQFFKYSLTILINYYIKFYLYTNPRCFYYTSMSNVLIRPSDLKELKKTFLELISSGYIEAKALTQLEISRGQFVRLCMEDPEFVKQIEEARKSRAEFWVSKIADDIDTIYDPKEVPGHKLRMEKLVFLAKADNPERYGTGKTKVDISLDLKQFKLLPPEEAVKALASDPFAIEAEYTEVSIDKNYTNLEIKNDEDLL